MPLPPDEVKVGNMAIGLYPQVEGAVVVGSYHVKSISTNV